MTNQHVDPKHIEDIIRQASATYIIPRFQKLGDGEVDTKSGPQDLVTAADIETETALTEIFKKEFPGCKVMGEEAVSRGEMTIDNTFTNEPDMLWVVDPVDGTWNFAHGSPVFACMVALRCHGETQASWIYNVMSDEFATAVKGEGATYAGQKLNMHKARKPLGETHGYITDTFAPEDIQKAWAQKSQNVATVGSLRSSAQAYIRLARGIVDFHITTREKPWDHLAGDLLIREAGGTVKTWDREPYHPLQHEEGILSTFSEEQWEDLHANFIEDVLELR